MCIHTHTYVCTHTCTTLLCVSACYCGRFSGIIISNWVDRLASMSSSSHIRASVLPLSLSWAQEKGRRSRDRQASIDIVRSATLLHNTPNPFTTPSILLYEPIRVSICAMISHVIAFQSATGSCQKSPDVLFAFCTIKHLAQVTTSYVYMHVRICTNHLYHSSTHLSLSSSIQPPPWPAYRDVTPHNYTHSPKILRGRLLATHSL